MGDSKRWSVTYTKHLKQKRKVYQDGALELHASCQKVLLYDDCGKLLVSRCLKKDEVIESGGTLTFDAHLVDIGELEGICKPLRDVNIQRKDEKLTEKMGIQRQKASCNSSENRTQFPYSGTSHNRTVVMKKIVTGNKQIGLQNSGMPQKQPNAVPTSREWHALYTTHMTQKAKRYHDGTLRLSLCGSHQRQVMLYDDCGKLLATRFLKKDELVESGVELAFDTHLVDIGDLKENSKCQTVLNVEGDKQSIGKIGTIGQKVRHNSSVGNLRNDDHSGRVAGLYSSRSIVDGFTSSGRAPRNDLLRDGLSSLHTYSCKM
ncbi:hypothetical protein AAC387_Pa12g1909 [Persea americana]